MATEDQNREDNTTREQHSLDELAKGLANGSISRSRAIQLMGWLIVGGVLSTVPGLAWGQDPPDDKKGDDKGKGLPPDDKKGDDKGKGLPPDCGPNNPCVDPDLHCCEGVCQPVEFFQTPEACGECPAPGQTICAEGQKCCCPPGLAGPGVCQCCDPNAQCIVIEDDPETGPRGVCLPL